MTLQKSVANSSSVTLRYALLLALLPAVLGACSHDAGSHSPGVATGAGDGIVGGQTVNLKDTRFAAAVLRLVAVERIEIGGVLNTRKSNCTGTLIAPNIVVTAGHCIDDLRDKKLYPMLINPRTGKAHSKGFPVMVVGRSINHDSLSVIDIAVPPGFRSKNGLSSPDIALLKLNRPLKLASRAMRPKVDTIGLAKTGRHLLAMGFGLTSLDPNASEQERRPPAELQKKTFTVIPASKVKWRESRKSPDLIYLATERGQTKGNLCQGDSGGPVFRKHREKIYLVGVNARSDRSCEGVGAATSVAAHSRWIRHQAAKWQGELY